MRPAAGNAAGRAAREPEGAWRLSASAACCRERGPSPLSGICSPAGAMPKGRCPLVAGIRRRASIAARANRFPRTCPAADSSPTMPTTGGGTSSRPSKSSRPTRCSSCCWTPPSKRWPDAGYDRRPLDRNRVGVVVGAMFGDEFSQQLNMALRLPEFQRTLRAIADRARISGRRDRRTRQALRKTAAPAHAGPGRRDRQLHQQHAGLADHQIVRFLRRRPGARRRRSGRPGGPGRRRRLSAQRLLRRGRLRGRRPQHGPVGLRSRSAQRAVGPGRATVALQCDGQRQRAGRGSWRAAAQTPVRCPPRRRSDPRHFARLRCRGRRRSLSGDRDWPCVERCAMHASNRGQIAALELASAGDCRPPRRGTRRRSSRPMARATAPRRCNWVRSPARSATPRRPPAWRPSSKARWPSQHGEMPAEVGLDQVAPWLADKQGQIEVAAQPTPLRPADSGRATLCGRHRQLPMTAWPIT